MLVRLLIFLAVALLIFLPINWIAWRQLVRIHPQRKRVITTALVAGNLMWPFFPLLATFTPFSRAVRAVLGPIWWGWQSFVLLYCLMLLVVALAWMPFRARRSFPSFAERPSRIFIAILIFAFVAGYYQAIVPLHVERVTIRDPRLPVSLHATRLVLMGDLHVGLFTRPSRLQTIFETAERLAPHAVLIAGDLIDDDPYFAAKLLDGAAHLDASIPLYAVLGNHEMYGDPDRVIKRLRGSRIRLLVNEGVALRDLWIAGVADPAARQLPHTALVPDLGKALAQKPPASYPLVLAHQPRVIDEARRRAIPVALCAHTHGGQFGVKPLGWSLAGVFLRYHMGLYEVPPTRLYVNTGTGYWLFPFRLGMPPEITVVELRSH